MTPTIRRVQALDAATLEGLAGLLCDAVDGGASVSFMAPLSPRRALDFWAGIGRSVDRGERALLVAEDAQGVAGTVHLVLDQPENQPHRADLSKLLVHRRARRQGLGEALMRAAEPLARACGKDLLVLDTAAQDAMRLYERLGWIRCGEIPGFALAPQGGRCATVLYYRSL